MLKVLPGEVTAFRNTLYGRALEKADTKKWNCSEDRIPGTAIAGLEVGRFDRCNHLIQVAINQFILRTSEPDLLTSRLAVILQLCVQIHLRMVFLQVFEIVDGSRLFEARYFYATNISVAKGPHQVDHGLLDILLVFFKNFQSVLQGLDRFLFSPPSIRVSFPLVFFLSSLWNVPVAFLIELRWSHGLYQLPNLLGSLKNLVFALRRQSNFEVLIRTVFSVKD